MNIIEKIVNDKLSFGEVFVYAFVLTVGILGSLYLIILIFAKIRDLITIKHISKALDINYKNRIPTVITTFDIFHLRLTGAVKDLYDRSRYPTKTIDIVCLNSHKFELFFGMIQETKYMEHNFDMVSCSGYDDPIVFLFPKEIEFNPGPIIHERKDL